MENSSNFRQRLKAENCTPNWLPGFMILAFALFWPNIGFPTISHLELGAANYGIADGDSELRFKYLFDKVDLLVKRYGSEGIIYLNDIDAEGLEYATKELELYLRGKGLTKIQVRRIPGSYLEIKKFPRVQTADLGNPGWPQLPAEANPGNMGQNKKIVNGLVRIAKASKTGLTINTTFIREVERIQDYLPKGLFEKVSDSGAAYYSPNGYLLEGGDTVAVYRLANPDISEKKNSYAEN